MTHNETYKELENLYIKNRENGNKKEADYYLNEMYKLLKLISYNYIKKYCEKKNIHLDIREKAHDSAIFVICRYLKNPDFRVEKISAYIYFGVLKALFQDKEYEMSTISLDDL
jgi:hypothetical protein